MPAPPPRKRSPSELERKHRDTPRLLPPDSLMVCLHNIRSMHNVGSAFRTCDAFAVDRLLLTGYTPHPPRLEISKTALGADEWVPWRHEADGASLLREYRRQGWTVVAVEQTHDSQPVDTGLPDPQTRPLLLVFGNEVLGVDDDILALADRVVEIPQYGRKHSLNISVSLGIVVYAAHQAARRVTGFA